MSDEEVVYTHIPRVGRSGKMLMLKDDRPRCVRFFDNGTCDCSVYLRGVVWSEVMSDVKVAPYANLGESYVDIKIVGDFDQDDLEDLAASLSWERDARAEYMERDISLASGQSYNHC